MKESHIYQRMFNPQVMKGYYKMIRESDITVVEELFKNITDQAQDHPNYNSIYIAYKERMDNDNQE